MPFPGERTGVRVRSRTTSNVPQRLEHDMQDPAFCMREANQHKWWGFAGTEEAAINGFGVRVHGVGGRWRLTFCFRIVEG